MEDQYVYFTSPEQQNDPAEGYIEYYWKGDWIAWLGLFKNYVWQIYMSWGMVPLDISLNELKKLYLTRTEIHWKDAPIVKKRARLEAEFAADPHIKKLAEALGNLDFELSAPEVQIILFTLHFVAIQYANKALEEDGLSPFQPGSGFELKPEYGRIDTLISGISSKDYGREELFAMAKAAMSSLSSVALSAQFFSKDDKAFNKKEIWTHLLMEFPKVYINRIPVLTFPDWYCVCFSSDYSNPALWGYYADRHQGVCLVFKNTPDEGIKLTKIDADGKEGKLFFKVEKVKYGEPPIKIDFFSGLGNLWGDEREHWLIHNGKKSIKLSEIFLNEELWRSQFWHNNTERFLRKSVAWAGEEEYRITLDDWWESHAKDEHRRYQYDFNDLDGIIFGINTPLDAKLEIIKIIRKKCEEGRREDFHFYQAAYNAETSKIELEEITLFGIKR